MQVLVRHEPAGICTVLNSNQERLYLHGSHGWVGVSLLRVSHRAYCWVLAVAVLPDRGMRRAPLSPSSIHHLSLRVRPLYTSLPSYGFQDKETPLGVHFTFGKQLRTLDSLPQHLALFQTGAITVLLWRRQLSLGVILDRAFV